MIESSRQKPKRQGLVGRVGRNGPDGKQGRRKKRDGSAAEERVEEGGAQRRVKGRRPKVDHARYRTLTKNRSTGQWRR